MILSFVAFSFVLNFLDLKIHVIQTLRKLLELFI